jgi:hypothetical protein
MLPIARGWLNTLQLGLLLSTCGWGISFYFTFAPWDSAAGQLYNMGAEHIPYDPLLSYWMRMASGVFGCIGIGSALACARPREFVSFIRLLGPFHFMVGSILAVAAVRNHLTPALHPTFVPDITFCFVTGTLIQLPLMQGRKALGKDIEEASTRPR